MKSATQVAILSNLLYYNEDTGDWFSPDDPSDTPLISRTYHHGIYNLPIGGEVVTLPWGVAFAVVCSLRDMCSADIIAAFRDVEDQ